jgi:ABC-2 type transport system permease protein
VARASAFIDSAAREWRFLRRNPWELALASWLPLLCVAMFAWLLHAGVARDLPIAVVDDDRSALSRELIRSLDASPGLEVTARPRSRAEAFASARSLDVYAIVYIPSGATRDVARGGSATVFGFYNASYQTAGQAAIRDIGAVVQDLSGRVARREVARARGPARVRPAPVVAQASLLFNPARSYEYFLFALLAPALLLFALCLSVTSAFGRELRDGTVASWLGSGRVSLLPAMAGKAAPYLLIIVLEGAASLAWLTLVRGEHVRGSVTMLVLGQGLLFGAYAAIGLLLIGLTKDMGLALSVSAVYAGTSLPFSGGTFPTLGGPAFVRAWSSALPFTSYVKLQAEQLSIGSPWATSLIHIVALSLFVVIPGAIGLRLYGRAAQDPSAWGRR